MKQKPEGVVKNEVKKILLSYGIFPAKDAHQFTKACHGWYFMPSQNGFGITAVPDFIGHYQGKFFAIETKAPGKVPTKLQQFQLDALNISGAKAFTIDGNYEALKKWLTECVA